ncbi:hypothetical protein BpHYR1_036887 [Brachionus plicatilis]|uniref:Uncharacterized protein n=1 Tax=Brachionus plicatilis TaxID=10195 RepID=A0A3M7QSI0_BRAPC|nr:hypothetical protein BpHYR1_036887 [Brachionus plicatilis]
MVSMFDLFLRVEEKVYEEILTNELKIIKNPFEVDTKMTGSSQPILDDDKILDSKILAIYAQTFKSAD